MNGRTYGKAEAKIPASFKAVKARMTDEARNRIIVCIDGPEKTGKSHFSLTAALEGPVANMHIDAGQEGVLAKFLGKEGYAAIGTVDYKLPLYGKHDLYKAEWLRYKTDFDTFLRDPDVTTIVCDTATDMYELMRQACFGRLEKVPPLKYTEVNNAYRALIRKAYSSNKNLILLHRVKKEYAGSGDIKEWTGSYTRDGFTSMGYLTQVNILTMKKKVKAKGKDGKPLLDSRNQPIMRTQFGLVITDCRHDPQLEGVELWGKDCNFSNLKRLVLGVEG